MNLRIFIDIPNIMITEQLRQKLGNFLGKKTDNIVENGQNAEGQQVCDLDTGDCYTVRMKDGLIERVDNTMKLNRTMKVETRHGVKTLLNG